MLLNDFQVTVPHFGLLRYVKYFPNVFVMIPPLFGLLIFYDITIIRTIL